MSKTRKLVYSGRHDVARLMGAFRRCLFGIRLADVEGAVPSARTHGFPGETLLEDSCHLNARGERITRSVFERRIVEVLSR